MLTVPEPLPAYDAVNPFSQTLIYAKFKDPNHKYAEHKVNIVHRNARYFWLDIRDPAKPGTRIDEVVTRDEVEIIDGNGTWAQAEDTLLTWWTNMGSIFCH